MDATVTQDVQNVLKGAAGRILRARALECAAVFSCAAGLCSAGLELAWALADEFRVAASAVCFLPWLSCSAILFFPTIRRRLRIGAKGCVGLLLFCALSSSLGCALVATGLYVHWPKAALPLVMILAGALVGLIAVCLRGVAIHEAAAWLDQHAGLRERLTTAAELIDSSPSDPSVMEEVCRQALAALRQRRAEEISVWQRGRGTIGAMMLVLLLCVAMACLPSPGRGQRDVRADELAGAVLASAEGRRGTAETFRRAAQSAAPGTKLSSELARAAQIVELGDEAELRTILRSLRESGVNVRSLIGPDVPGLRRGEAAGRDDALRDRQLPVTREAKPTRSDAIGRWVRVYDPSYAKAPSRTISGQHESRPPMVATGVPYADAWKAAQERAAARAAAGRIPPQYRRLVRDFFESR